MRTFQITEETRQRVSSAEFAAHLVRLLPKPLTVEEFCKELFIETSWELAGSPEDCTSDEAAAFMHANRKEIGDYCKKVVDLIIASSVLVTSGCGEGLPNNYVN
jgi:hypothetical protein